MYQNSIFYLPLSVWHELFKCKLLWNINVYICQAEKNTLLKRYADVLVHEWHRRCITYSHQLGLMQLLSGSVEADGAGCTIMVLIGNKILLTKKRRIKAPNFTQGFNSHDKQYHVEAQLCSFSICFKTINKCLQQQSFLPGISINKICCILFLSMELFPQ